MLTVFSWTGSAAGARRRIAVSLFALSAAVLAPAAHAMTIVPPRTHEMSAAAVWQQRQNVPEAAPQTTSGKPVRGASSAHKDYVIVGLKAPGGARGEFDGKILITRARVASDVLDLKKIGGLAVERVDPTLPQVTIRVTGEATLDEVQAEKYVDYIEPLYQDDELAEFPGCAGDPLNALRQVHTRPGDVVPRSYKPQGILDAWADGATGHGITVAVLDTGVERDQGQVTPRQFTDGMSGGRWVKNLGTRVLGSGSPYSNCAHGTRVAGLIAAPRDGKSTVGIAWRANLVTVNVTPYVVFTPFIDTDNIISGIRIALANGARIINMSFGSPFYDYALADAINYYYYYQGAIPSQPCKERICFTIRPLFVAAIGSIVCLKRIFPGSWLPNEVISAAGVANDGHTISKASCGGAAIGGIVGSDDSVPVPGATPVETFGASSAGTATISGILALIWSKHPNWTRDHVRQALFASATHIGSTSGVLYSAPNAFTAIGGFSKTHGTEMNSPGRLRTSPTRSGYCTSGTEAPTPVLLLSLDRRQLAGAPACEVDRWLSGPARRNIWSPFALPLLVCGVTVEGCYGGASSRS